MALQGQTVVAASGDSGSEDCYPTSTQLAVDDPGSQPDVREHRRYLVDQSLGFLPGRVERLLQTISRHVNVAGCADQATGAGGGGYSTEWPANPGQPASGPACTRAGGSCRAVPDISYPADPSDGGVVAYSSAQHGWSAFGGTSVAAPTNAGLVADTNQGCFSPLGRVGPTLYVAAGASASNFTDVTNGNNDLTDSHGGAFPAAPGFDPASGLGSPVDQNLALALQGADGCPSVASVSPDTGPGHRRRRHHDHRGRVRRRDVGHVRVGRHRPDRLPDGDLPHGRSAQRLRTPSCVDVTVANAQGISATSAADQYGFGGDLDCGHGLPLRGLRRRRVRLRGRRLLGQHRRHPSQPARGRHGRHAEHQRLLAGRRPTAASSPSATPASSARWAASPSTSRSSGMAATPDGGGYWLVASDGGIFSFGDASFYGSTGAMRLNEPIVGMAATPDGGGYWLVASDGGIFASATRSFYGSTGVAAPRTRPSSAWRPAPSGGGYWLVASDGGIFDYGDAGFFGSAGGLPPEQARRRHGRHARRRRLLAGGVRRRHLHVRRRARSTGRPAASC